MSAATKTMVPALLSPVLQLIQEAAARAAAALSKPPLKATVGNMKLPVVVGVGVVEASAAAAAAPAPVPVAAWVPLLVAALRNLAQPWLAPHSRYPGCV